VTAPGEAAAPARPEPADPREQLHELQTLQRLLPLVASTLEVRDVFHKISMVARELIPHHAMGIQSVQPDGKTMVAYIVTADAPGDSIDYKISRDLHEHDLIDAVVHELTFDPADGLGILRGRFFAGADGSDVVAKIDETRTKFVRESGFRSFLRIVLRRGEEKIGALVFSSRDPEQFRESQLPLARRIAEYVTLVLSHRHLAEEAERAAEARARAAMLEQRVQELVQQAEEREGFHRCVGESKSWKEILGQAARVAPTDTTVLLTGESGTGKEVVARLIHRGSPRANGPLVAVNCAALPEHLLESELFGYERGAFSGALSTKPGRIEQAARGVLFLDEIGEMGLPVQAKLLRVLQEREFQRLGGTRTMKADVRVVAATNRDLVAAMKRGEFREDLYYRLRVFEIRLPPLRDRRDDILPLTEAFLQDLEKSLGHRTAGLSREAKDILLAYDWPGNIRELRNALERAVILCDGGLITGEQLPLQAGGAPGTGAEAAATSTRVEDMEKALIEKALKQARNNKSQAARILGITRAQLYFRLEKYGLEKET
jgi:transcriptional regulator with GAF, ATPase, and Fis domain